MLVSVNHHVSLENAYCNVNPIDSLKHYCIWLWNARIVSDTEMQNTVHFYIVYYALCPKDFLKIY